MPVLVQQIILRIYHFLSGSRPITYIRKMQAYLLVVTLLLATFVLAYPGLSQKDLNLDQGGEWATGKHAPIDVVSVVALEFPQMGLYKLKKNEARFRTPLHFSRDFGVLGSPPSEEITKNDQDNKTFRFYLDLDLQRLAECRKDYTGNQLRWCVANSMARWKKLNQAQMNRLLILSNKKLRELVSRMVNIIFPRYVILKDKLNEPDFKGSTIRVNDINTGSEPLPRSLSFDAVVNRNQLYTYDVRRRMEELADERLTDVGEDLREALVHLSIRYLYLVHGSAFDKEATERARREAEKAVEIPIAKISRGDLIIKKGEVITDEKLEALQYYNSARSLDLIRRIVSIFIHQIMFIIIILYFSFRFSFQRLKDVSSNLIVFITIWLFLLTIFVQGSVWADNLEYNEVTHFFGAWVPIGLFVVLLSIIFGEVLTIPLAAYLAFLVFVASKYDPNSFLISMILALSGSVLGGRIHKRFHFITTAAFITLVGFIMVFTSYLYSSRTILAPPGHNGLFSSNIMDALWVMAGSGMTTIFVIAVLPIYEAVFNIPTKFKLQELSDPSNPLLQELFRQAPSTWTHTLMVASMSEKAGEKLGLNTDLIRTGVYYHDIGKMKNPGFFIENQHLIPRPEKIDQNRPEVAAREIILHVINGMEMARNARLPREVAAFIPEHHGTSTMSFFYHKALEKMRRKVNRDDFRYPGPRPQSKETGIVMIADSVEAASRSLDFVTPEKVDELIQKIINMKLSENQLDESGLTVGDLSVVRESFRDIILSSYHNRPRYPDAGDTKKLESDAEKKSKKRSSKKKS